MLGLFGFLAESKLPGSVPALGGIALPYDEITWPRSPPATSLRLKVRPVRVCWCPFDTYGWDGTAELELRLLF